MSNLNENAIPILYDDRLSNISYVNELCYGLEEQEVLYITKKIKIDHPLEKVYENTRSNRFGVAITLNNEKLIVHYKNLNKNEPIFYYNVPFMTLGKFRSVGENAARLVKSKPLKAV